MGAHIVMYSCDAPADRAFLAEMLGFESIDAGGGWLIFRLPPAELAVHPADASGAALYLMCDDIATEIASLAERGVTCTDVEDVGWGLLTSIPLPSGGQLGMYQPKHPSVVKVGYAE